MKNNKSILINPASAFFKGIFTTHSTRLIISPSRLFISAGLIIFFFSFLTLCGAQTNPVQQNSVQAYKHYTDSVNSSQQTVTETHKLAAELKLSAEQVQKVQKINLDYYNQVANVNSAVTSTYIPPGTNDKLKELNNARIESVLNILTESQKALYKTNEN